MANRLSIHDIQASDWDEGEKAKATTGGSTPFPMFYSPPLSYGIVARHH